MDYVLNYPQDYDPPKVGRPTVSIQQYIEAGLKKNILFLGTDGEYDPATKLWTVGRRPSNTKQTTRWACTRCTRGVIKKSYFSLMQDDNYGCRCQNGDSLQPHEYHAYATEMGILWRPDHDLLPHNTRTKTQWLTLNGTKFEASKWELDNTKRPINSKLKELIRR